MKIDELKRNKEETEGEIPSFVIGEVNSDAEAAEIIANLDAHRPDQQMTLAKKGCGMSFATKMDVVRTCFNENDVQVVIDPKREV